MDVREISRIIKEHIPLNGDAFQDVWLHLLETDRDDINQIHRSIRKAKNRRITEYFRKKKEVSQVDEQGDNILDRYIVPAELEINDNESVVTVKNDFYRQIAIYFLKEFLLEKQKNRELRQRQLDMKAQTLLERQKKRELLKELSNKKLENSQRWRELYRDQLNKKNEIFQKKYELRKRKLDLEAEKLEKKQRTRLTQNALQTRLTKIEKSIQLQQEIISRIIATDMFRRINP